MGSSSTGGTDAGAAPKSHRAAQDLGMQKKSNISIAANAVGNYVKGGGMVGILARAAGLGGKPTTSYNPMNDQRATGYKFDDGFNNGGSDTAPTQVATNVGGKIIKSPTTAEVSQSNATDTAAYDNRKTKAKGRSMTILTSSRGVGKDTKAVLGTKSLLGSA
jgi:hypothetical protein